MGQFKHYYDYVEVEAGNLFSDYKEDMLEAVYEGNNRMYDFFDEHVHHWVDQDMCSCDLMDHAEILEQSEDVESDWGLWEGMKDPRKAIESQAFFTYRGDLMRAVLTNAKAYLEELEENMNEQVVSIEEEIEELSDRLQDLQEAYNNNAGPSDLEEQITEVESDIMLAEERLDEAKDKLNCLQESIEECC